MHNEIYEVIMKDIHNWRPENKLRYPCCNLMQQKERTPKYLIQFHWSFFIGYKAILCEVYDWNKHEGYYYREIGLTFDPGRSREMYQIREDILAEMKDDRYDKAYDTIKGV